MKETKLSFATWKSGIEKTDRPMKKVLNRWQTAINWCNDHNHEYTIGYTVSDGMGHCDSTTYPAIVIKTAFGEEVAVIERPKESCQTEKYWYDECVKKLAQYREEEYREDSKKITKVKMAIEKHAARLFEYGYNTDMTDTTELIKEFNLE